jgi:hypothetical protein
VELGFGDSSRFLDRWLNDILLVLVLSTALIPFHFFEMLFWCLTFWGHDFFHISSLLSGIALHQDSGFCLDRGVANASSVLMLLLNSLQ